MVIHLLIEKLKSKKPKKELKELIDATYSISIRDGLISARMYQKLPISSSKLDFQMTRNIEVNLNSILHLY